ncbi:MAG: cadmium resistance transporter [Acidimicrobiales bacterium]
MTTMASVALAPLAFLVTNADTFVFMAALSATTDRRRAVELMAGQFVGFVIVLVCVLALSAGLATVSMTWLGLFGLLPLAIGIRALRDGRRDPPAAGGDGGRGRAGTGSAAGSVVAVGAAVVGHGADNIAVLVPYFRTLTTIAVVATCMLFVVCDVVLCVAAFAVGAERHVRGVADHLGALVVPVIYIIVGLVVMGQALADAVWCRTAR